MKIIKLLNIMKLWILFFVFCSLFSVFCSLFSVFCSLNSEVPSAVISTLRQAQRPQSPPRNDCVLRFQFSVFSFHLSVLHSPFSTFHLSPFSFQFSIFSFSRLAVSSSSKSAAPSPCCSPCLLPKNWNPGCGALCPWHRG